MHIFLAFIYLLIHYTMTYSQMMYPNIISIGSNKPIETIWLLPDYYLKLCDENIQSVTCFSHKNSSLNNLELQKFCNILSYPNFVFKRINLTLLEPYEDNCCQITYSNLTSEKACYIDSKIFMNFFTTQVLQIKSFLIKNPSGLLNDGNIKKYLPIPSGPLAFSLLIDLQDEFQVFYIILRLLPPWPGLIDFEKRIATTALLNPGGDFGSDWQWQKLDIMSLSCMPTSSGGSSNHSSSSPDSTNKLFPSECRAKSSIRKSTRGEVKIINIANIMRQSLARWIKITFWRNSDMTPASTEQFYNIQEISIVGRCVCNGRASSCNLTSFPYVCNCTRDQGFIYADSNKCVTEDEHAWNSMDSDNQNTSFSSIKTTQDTLKKAGPPQSVRVQTWLHGLGFNIEPNGRNLTVQRKNQSGGEEVNLRFLWKGVEDKLLPYYPNTTTKVEYYGNLSSYNQKIIDDYLKANSLPPNIVDLIDFTRAGDYNAKEGVVNYFDNPTTSTFITATNITARFADQPVTTFSSPYNASSVTFHHFDVMAYGTFKNDHSLKNTSHLNKSYLNSSFINASHLNSSHAESSHAIYLDEGSGLEKLFNGTDLDGNFTTTIYTPFSSAAPKVTLPSRVLSNYNGPGFVNTTLLQNITKTGLQLSERTREIMAAYPVSNTNYESVYNFSTESWTSLTTAPKSLFEMNSSHFENFSTPLPTTKIIDNQSINTSDHGNNDTISTSSAGDLRIIAYLTTLSTIFPSLPITESIYPYHELNNIPQAYVSKSQSTPVKFKMASSTASTATLGVQLMSPPVDLDVALSTNQPYVQPVFPASPENLVYSNALPSSLIGQSFNGTSPEVSLNALINSLAFQKPKLYDCLQLSRNQNQFVNSSFDAKLCFDSFVSLDFFPNSNDKTWSKRIQTPITNQNLDFWKIFLLLSAINSNKVNPSISVFSRQSSLPTLSEPMMIEVEDEDSNDYSLPFYRQVWFTVALSFLAFCALVCFFLAMLRKHKYRIIEWYPAKLSGSPVFRNTKSPTSLGAAMRTSSLYGTVNGYPRSATKYRNTPVNGVYQKKVNADVHQLYVLENPNFNYDEIIMYDFEDNNAAASSQDLPVRSVRQLYSIPETRI